jgi:hypothetical protein
MSGALQFSVMMPNYILDVVELCCQVDPDRRPTIDQLMANDLFRAQPTRTGPAKGLSLHVPACLSFAGARGHGQLTAPKMMRPAAQAGIGESQSLRNIGAAVAPIRPRQIVKPHIVNFAPQPGRIKTAASVTSMAHLFTFVPK